MEFVLKVVFFASAFTVAAFPQGSGKATGTITDQSGAAIPGARLTLTNTATNLTPSKQTNNADFCFFPGLISDAYRLAAEAPRMEKYTAAFTAQVEQSVVLDLPFAPGQTTTIVEVTDVTPLVKTGPSTRGHFRICFRSHGGGSPAELFETNESVRRKSICASCLAV